MMPCPLWRLFATLTAGLLGPHIHRLVAHTHHAFNEKGAP